MQLALDRKNQWIISQLQQHYQLRGLGRANWIKKLINDATARRTILMCTASVPMFSVGLILEHSPWWFYTVFLVSVIGYFSSLTINTFRHAKENPFPLGIYFSTKAYMLVTLWFYFWPFIEHNYNALYLFTVCFSLLCYFLLKAWRSDPGFINASEAQQKKNIIEMAEGGQLQDFSKFCTTCLIRRPLRSKHCQICDRCVARMDHHCPWIDNCVGLKNHAHFVFYLLFLFIANMFYLWGSLKYYNAYCGPFDAGTLISIIRAAQQAPWVSFGFAMGTFHSIWVAALLSCNLYQVLWLGMTTNERMNVGRYRHFHDAKNGGIKSPFSSGLLQNVADFFNVNLVVARPRNIDWMNEYDMRDFQGPQTNWRNNII
jgi:palmitoyltransferase